VRVDAGDQVGLVGSKRNKSERGLGLGQGTRGVE